MLQYFVGKLFGDLPANFNFVVGKRLECGSPQNGGYYYEMYEGVNKNNEGVCIFIYDKKGKEGSREKRYTSNHLAFSKKLIHPNILKVLYTYESDKRIYIVTEKCVPLHIEGVRSDPLWGLYEIFSAVYFVSMCNYVHCLVNPLSVFVNERGRWKLSLFDCIHEKGESIHHILNDLKDHIVCTYGYAVPIPNGVHATWVDAHGLAFLMAWSYKSYLERRSHFGDADPGVPSIRRSSPHGSGTVAAERGYYLKTPMLNGEDAHEGLSTRYVFQVDLHRTAQECIPKRLLPFYRNLLKYSKKEINFFTILDDHSLRTDSTISTMLFLTQIHMKSKSEKVQFLDNLFSKLENISSSVKTEKILPELVQNVEVSESRVTCLKIVLTISRELPTEQFDKMIFPTVSKYFSIKDRSIRFVLLENFHHIEKHLTSNHMNEIYNSYRYGFLDNNTSIKNESIKNFIYVFPKLKSNFKSSSLMALLDNLRDSDFCVRTNTIICVAKIAKYILDDKENILENVYKVGLQESFVQTRLATIQAVKFTYDQFSAKKYASNILPLLVRSLIDDSSEVRLAAFDAMDSVCAQLRGDLLGGSTCGSSRGSGSSPPIPSGTSSGDATSTSPVDFLKGYTFINKIKGIISAKGELDAGSGSRATQEGGPSVSDFSGTVVQTGEKDSDPLSTLVYDVPPVGGALGSVGSRTHLNVNSQTGVYNSGERHLAAFQQDYDQRGNFIFEEEMKNYHDRRGWEGGGDRPGQGDRSGHYEQGNQGSYYNCELVSMSRSGETNQEDSLFDGNFYLEESAKGTAQKAAQKIDLDIDDFFKEFDLKEDSSAKVKLSSL
ncbi:SCY1 protein kinase [Plasmodium inui San Antonio 1]|uniref:SCY1 protein kinase n=1 Tax=Plasmodium inui San Antonio 1 TaxID=1237626 RepID=W7A913_9APIC|nr:SCY1 protein kinase [Plasmodium inui San Antonio 1]EUD68160.1 SCY1 protein kinase [Plasmodium inui San Antonio 1]